jgi:hypothetical protein
LQIFDVGVPSAPALLGTGLGYGAQGIAATGTTVILATPATNHFDAAGGVYVVDATVGSQPRLVKQVTVPGTTMAADVAGGWAFAGDAAGIVDVIGLVP